MIFDLSTDFAEKCVKNGIAHPVGMCFQDLGWKAGPIVTGKDVEHVTWREYFERFCDEPEETVRLNQDQILCALPVGQPDFATDVPQGQKA